MIESRVKSCNVIETPISERSGFQHKLMTHTITLREKFEKHCNLLSGKVEAFSFSIPQTRNVTEPTLTIFLAITDEALTAQ